MSGTFCVKIQITVYCEACTGYILLSGLTANIQLYICVCIAYKHTHRKTQ